MKRLYIQSTLTDYCLPKDQMLACPAQMYTRYFTKKNSDISKQRINKQKQTFF